MFIFDYINCASFLTFHLSWSRSSHAGHVVQRRSLVLANRLCYYDSSCSSTIVLAREKIAPL